MPSDAGATATATTLATGDRVVVTGAAGFIGSAITRALLGRGAEVVAPVEPGSDTTNLNELPVEKVELDIVDRDGVHAVTEGARFVFHCAARYGFWAADPQDFYRVNVEGTRNVVAAATAAGCERVVYTSTVGTLGLQGTGGGGRADESAYAQVDHLFGLYKQSKYVAEHEVLKAAAEGAPVCMVLPTFPVGPGDRRPTPTGKLVLDFLNGRMPAFVETTLNVAHVDDLAACHLLALQQGRNGRQYIAGGENLSMQQVLALLAEATGLPAPRRRVPGALAIGAGLASDLVQGRLLGREPSVPLEAARMSTTHMSFDDERARRELGYSSRPARHALLDAARWYASQGFVSPGRLQRIHWADDGRAAVAPDRASKPTAGAAGEGPVPISG